MFCHSFESGNDIFLFNKTHLTVYLSKLRLTVCTKIFITETLYNLEVTIKAGNHQQLLQFAETAVVHKTVPGSYVKEQQNHELLQE